MSLAEDLNPRAVPGHNNPPLADLLADRYVDLLDAIQPIADRATSLPKKITDDIALGRLGDVVRDARKLSKAIDGKRKEEVDPHLAAQRETNGFFNAHKDRLDSLAQRLELLATDYQRAKAAEERRKLEEEARRAREEEDRQREAAQVAQEKGRVGTALKHDDRAEEAAGRAARLETAAHASAADLTRVRSGSGTVATSRQSWKFTIDDFSQVPLETLRPYLAADAIEKAIGKYVGIHKGAGKLAGVTIFQDTKATFR